MKPLNNIFKEIDSMFKITSKQKPIQILPIKYKLPNITHNTKSFFKDISIKKLPELKKIEQRGFKSIKNILKDSDKDGVPNIFDCRPYNPKMQDIKPNISMRKELKKLPIFFTGGKASPGKTGKLYPYEAKKMSKGAYKAKRRFLSTVKKRPEVVGEIKRKKPKAVIVTTKGVESEGYGAAYQTEKGKKPVSIAKGKAKGKHVVVVRATSLGRGHRYGREDVDETAATAIHEHEHLRQFKTYEKRPKIKKRMTSGRYAKRREEILAQEAEAKAERKRYKSYPSRKRYLEGLAAFQKRMEELDEKEKRS